MNAALRLLFVWGALAVPGLACADLAACTVAMQPVMFGNYSASSASPADTTGTVTLNCVSAAGATVGYTMALSSGGGSYSNRLLSAGGNALSYQLYRDLGHTVVWGDGISGGTATVSGTLVVPAASVPASSSATVYGRIPAAQISAPAAAYSDTITVTVTY